MFLWIFVTCVDLSREQLQRVFDEQIEKMFRLIDDQLQKLEISHPRENIVGSHGELIWSNSPADSLT
jgi:hypothetical protein